MTTTVLPPPERTRARTVRLVVFQVLMALIALLHIVVYGAWQEILVPWVELADAAEHGWARTPELHRLADAAAGVISLAIAAGAVLLTVRPVRNSGLASWTAAALVLTGGFAWLSAAIQGHEDVVSALAFSAVWVALIAAIFVWLHPEGREILRGGGADGSGPAGVLRAALVGIGTIALIAAIGAVIWRLAGGVFENPLEDDVIGLVYFGLLWALGCVIAVRGRAGWRPLSMILLVGAGYAVVAGIWITLV